MSELETKQGAYAIVSVWGPAALIALGLSPIIGGLMMVGGLVTIFKTSLIK